MNILMFCRGMGPAGLQGGIQTYVANLSRALGERGNEVHILTDGRTPGEFDNVHVRPFPWFPVAERCMPGLGQSWHIARAVRELHHRLHLDVIEFPNWEAPGLVYNLAKEIPTVTRLHTSFAETMKLDRLPMGISNRFLLWSERAAVRMSTAVVTHTASHRRRMARELALPVSRIEVIPHGIFVPERPEPFRPAGERDLDVLYVGRLEHRKGTQDLLDAIPDVLRRVKRARFTFVGQDRPHAPGKRTFQEYFRSQFPEPVRRPVRFLGAVSRQELDRLYRQCDLLVAPSLYESFGLIYIEAMRFGKPVIGCRTGGIPEVVKDGFSGLLVEPSRPDQLARAIADVLSHDDLREKLSVQAHAWTREQFSIEGMARRCEEFYGKTIQRYRANRGTT